MRRSRFRIPEVSSGREMISNQPRAKTSNMSLTFWVYAVPIVLVTIAVVGYLLANRKKKAQ